MRHRLQALGPLIVVTVLVATLWAIVLVSASIQRQRITDDTEKQLRLINSAVVQQTRGLLDNIDGNLEVLDRWLQAHPQGDPRQDTALTWLISRLNQSTDGLVSLGFVSTSGRAVAMPGTSAWHAGMPAITLSGPGDIHVGTPMRSAPGQAWQWPMSRRLSREVGEIAGTVAWVDVARLSALHEELRDKPAGAIALISSGAIMIARTPMLDGLIGRDLRKTTPLPVMPASAARGSFSYDGSLTDGPADRFVSYERLGRYPVTVFVSQGFNETMANFHSRRRLLLTVMGFISVFAFAFSVMLMRSQHATRRGQAEFAALGEAFPLGLFRTDTQGKTTYANDAYFQKLGLPRDQMAWGWLTLVEENQRETAAQAWRTAVAEGRPVKAVLKIRQPSGRDAVLSVHTAALRVDGRLVGQVGSMEDITDRIQQEKAQRMLTAIFEKSTDVVAQVGPRGGLLYLNPAGRALLALAPDAPLADLRYESFTPVHRVEQVREEILPAALDKGVWVGETSLLAAQGREVAVSEMLIVHRDNAQQIEAFSVVMRDITQELQARMELQRSESILNIVASTLPASVAVIDDQQRYLFTNDAFDHMVEKTHGSLIGKTMREALGEAEYEHRRLHVDAALAGRRAMFETERSLQGQSVFLETSYIPFRGANGRVAGFVGLAQDITVHRVQQQKLLDASQTDVLTGTLNRAGFDLRIHEDLARAQSERHLLALLCIDLDGFKPVNDQHGHAAGDSLLTAVAQRLQQALRPSDVLARLGGDEFSVLLPDVKNEQAAQAVARKIVGALAAPFQIDGKTVSIGGSVGVALTMNGKETVQTLLRRADGALYQAKRAGRGRFEMAAEA